MTDLAAVDVGTLDRWTLSLDLDGGVRDEWQTTRGVTIPDNDSRGIASELEVDGSGVMTDIELTVDITHTFRGDLRVTLETPGGLSARIHDLTGGGAHNLKQSYQAANTPALRSLVDAGVDIRGTWRLLVSDNATADLGKLNAWKLKLRT